MDLKIKEAEEHDPPVRVDAESVEKFWEGPNDNGGGGVCAPGWVPHSYYDCQLAFLAGMQQGLLNLFGMHDFPGWYAAGLIWWENESTCHFQVLWTACTYGNNAC